MTDDDDVVVVVTVIVVVVVMVVVKLHARGGQTNVRRHTLS